MERTRKNLPNTKLRDLRRQRGWTQADLANALGVTDLTVGRWERGEANPFLYYQQKMGDLFGMTLEELGFKTTPAESRPKTVLEESSFSVMAIINPQQDQEETRTPSSYGATDGAPLVLPPSFETPLSPARVDGKPRIFQRRISPIGFLWFSVVLVPIVIIGSWMIFLSGKQTTDRSQKVNMVKIQKANVSKAATLVLYHADWSRNPDNWPVSMNIHWVEGILKTDLNTENTIIFAPYSPALSSYAVEVQMQRTGYSGTGGQAYGVAVKTAPGDGYICGVGEHFYPEHLFMAQLNPASTAPIYRLSDLYDANTSLDNAWHTYRVEVNQQKMTFFLDHQLIQTVDIASYPQPGRVGIYVDNAAIAIKSFDVLTLS